MLSILYVQRAIAVIPRDRRKLHSVWPHVEPTAASSGRLFIGGDAIGWWPVGPILPLAQNNSRNGDDLQQCGQ